MPAPYIVHGTLLNTLTPGSLLRAAEADVERWRRNTSVFGGLNEAYAFDRRHVRKAMRADEAGAHQIIEVALNDLERGQKSSKRLTREVYRDAGVLASAIGRSSDER